MLRILRIVLDVILLSGAVWLMVEKIKWQNRRFKALYEAIKEERSDRHDQTEA